MLDGENMLEFLQCVFNITVHGADSFTFVVVPFEGDANVLLGVHIKFDWVVFADGDVEVVDMIFGGVFDAKVVNNKSEGDVSHDVFEESQGVGFDINILFEMGNQVIMGNFSSFLQSIPHTFYCSINIAINNLIIKVVVLDNFLEDEGILKVYILSIGEE